MRVAMILNSFPVISEKFLLNHIIGAIQAGINIDVYAAHRPVTDIRHELYAKYNVQKYVRYVDIPRSLKNRFLSAPFLFIKLLLKNPLAAFEAIRRGKYRTVATNVKLLYFGLAFVGNYYDVVHCHFGVNGLIGSYLKNCGFCTALVATFHGSDINTYPKKHGTGVYKTLYHTADLITANTAFTKSKIVANGCPETLIRIVPVGLIVDDYADIDRSQETEHTILTVGRLEEKKGHRYALDAVALVRRRIPDVRYFIAGAGSLAGELKEHAERLGISDCVHFIGLATSEQVKKLYKTCAVFTLPSVTASDGDMEGQGLVLQEAQICGMPVVSTLHNGIPDGVLEGISGFLVPEKDSSALAEKLILLLEDKKLRMKMGENGKKFVSEKYNISLLTDKINSFYGEILS
jgi:colanic acid/amylovoran biosynthesis glycosyltransferase